MILLLINIAAPILLPGIAFCCYCLFVVCQCLELLILVTDSREGILAESPSSAWFPVQITDSFYYCCCLFNPPCFLELLCVKSRLQKWTFWISGELSLYIVLLMQQFHAVELACRTHCTEQFLYVCLFMSSVLHCTRICGRWWNGYASSRSWMTRYLLLSTSTSTPHLTVCDLHME